MRLAVRNSATHISGLILVVIAVIIAIMLLITNAKAQSFWLKQAWPNTDFSKISVDFNSIRSGGPGKDGIPSIDDPQFAPVSDIDWLEDHEPVMSINMNGEARAYPLGILTRHEIVNDRIGDIAVAITYCPLCNAAIVFDRTVDGDVTEFGVSGNLRNSDMIMYDRDTESWWQQFTGEAIIGERLGYKLKTLPSRTESWVRFKERHPDGVVLSPANPQRYGRNPYVGYDNENTLPFLFNGDFPDDIPALAYVVLVKDAGDKPFIVALEKLRREKTLTREGVTLTFHDQTRSALDTSLISEARQIGSVSATRDGQDVVYDLTFAFVTHAFLPDIPIEQ